MAFHALLHFSDGGHCLEVVRNRAVYPALIRARGFGVEPQHDKQASFLLSLIVLSFFRYERE